MPPSRKPWTTESPLVTWSIAALQQGQHAIGLEALAYQITIQPVELAVVGDCLRAAQPLRQRSLHERSRIDRAKDLIERVFRRGGRDASAFNFPFDAELAALADRHLGPGDGFGDACVVDRALFEQTGDSLVYVGLVVFLPGEALA